MKKLSSFLAVIPNTLSIVYVDQGVNLTKIMAINNKLAITLIKKLKRKKIKIATMESCTGGDLISTLTNIPGASIITEGGLIIYSNRQKIAFGVPANLIKRYSVYSPQVAVAMAYQAQQKINGSNLSVGITGILAYDHTERQKNPLDRVDIAIIYKNKLFHRKILLVPQLSRAVAKARVVNETLKIILKILI